MAQDPSAVCFPTTHWSQVLQAGDPAAPEARAALEGLCRNYWLPLYAVLVPIDALAAEANLGAEPAHDQTPERPFERRWALTLLDRVRAGLDAEMAGSDKAALYQRLRPSLLGEEDGEPYQTIADALGLSQGAVKMAAHRLRARYRALLRAEIGRTVADPVEIDDEIRDLLAALGR
jgi:RNA polymerase sigma-70 factor (ECF subfamily)